MDKKYELIPSDIEGLFRVKALKEFNDVKKGDIGGYVESENNLSQLGDCWIYDDAIVCDNAVVVGNARVCDKAVVVDNAQVCDNAVVVGNTVVVGNARVWGNAIVRDDARVFANAQIYDNAVVAGNAVVVGNARVWGNAQICGNAMIFSDKDYIVFKNWWSSGRYFTWTRSNNMWKVGCFYGTGEQLINKALEDSVDKGFEYKKIVDYVESILENQRLNHE